MVYWSEEITHYVNDKTIDCESERHSYGQWTCYYNNNTKCSSSENGALGKVENAQFRIYE